MGLENIIEVISDVEFFSILSNEQMRLLAFASELKTYSEKDIIADQSKGNAGAYIIIDGVVNVNNNIGSNNKAYFVSGPNALIGERSLLLNKPLSALIIANSFVETLFIPHKAFYKLLQQYPEVAVIIKQRIEKDLDNYLRSFDGLR